MASNWKSSLFFFPSLSLVVRLFRIHHEPMWWCWLWYLSSIQRSPIGIRWLLYVDTFTVSRFMSFCPSSTSTSSSEWGCPTTGEKVLDPFECNRKRRVNNDDGRCILVDRFSFLVIPLPPMLTNLSDEVEWTIFTPMSLHSFLSERHRRHRLDSSTRLLVCAPRLWLPEQITSHYQTRALNWKWEIGKSTEPIDSRELDKRHLHIG